MPLTFTHQLLHRAHQWIQESMEEDELNLLITRYVETPNHHPSQRITIDRGRSEGAARLVMDYFSPSCTYTPRQFERQFRMSKRLFLEIYTKLCDHNPYWIQKPVSFQTLP